MNHDFVLFEGGAGLFVLGQESGVRLLEDFELGALLIKRLDEFVVLVFPLGGLRLNHGLEFGTADLPAFGLFNLDAKGVVQAFDLFKVLAGALLEGGHVGAVLVDHSGEALDFESGLAVVGLQ